MGIGAGVYFDFATSSFHVPTVLSAPKAATTIAAKIKHNLAAIRMFYSVLKPELCTDGV